MFHYYYTAQEILDQLDRCAQENSFPMLDNGYVYPVDVHLTAYRDVTRWAIIIQDIGVHNHAWQHDRIQNCLSCFGNCLMLPPGWNNESFLFPASEGLDSPTFADDNVWLIHPEATTIQIRDVRVPIPRDEQFYVQKGIEHELPPQITVIEMIRSLFPEYRHLFLATEREIRQHMPANLPLLLELTAWYHPNLGEEELPSQTSTFQMIAKVLETGDAHYYRPRVAPNTHWSNWPDGGSC